MYRRHPALLPILYNLVKDSEALGLVDYLKQLVEILVKIQTEYYSNIYEVKLKGFNRAVKDRRPLEEFDVGQIVMFYSNRGYGRKSKLTTLWSGPFEVIEKTGQNCYTLKDANNGQLVNKVHAKYMRRMLI